MPTYAIRFRGARNQNAEPQNSDSIKQFPRIKVSFYFRTSGEEMGAEIPSLPQTFKNHDACEVVKICTAFKKPHTLLVFKRELNYRWARRIEE